MRQRYAAATGRVAEVRKHRFGKQRAFSAVKYLRLPYQIVKIL
jgi:hypothetical protein